MKKITGIAITVVVIGGIVAVLAANKKKMEAETSQAAQTESGVLVSTVMTKSDEYSLDFTANGATTAINELNFVSNTQGRVIAIYADNGKYVRKGDKLLEVDSDLLQSDYEAAQAAYDDMKQNVDRMTRSNAVGGVTDQQLDGLKTQLKAAKSRLDRARKMLEDAVVKSPMDGRINMRYVELGSLIAPNAPLFDIVNDSQLKVTVGVPESRVKLLEKGQQVTLTNSSLPGRTFTGKINYIGIKTDRGLNYPVEIYIDKDDALRIGMYLKVQFNAGTGRNGVLVPRKAIVGSAKAANVYVIKDGKAVKRQVVLGEMIGDNVEILDGISAGEELITAGIMNVADGTEVTVVK